LGLCAGLRTNKGTFADVGNHNPGSAENTVTFEPTYRDASYWEFQVIGDGEVGGTPPQLRRSGCGTKKMAPFLRAADEVVCPSTKKNCFGA
jgi:hypothetical protein